MKELKVTWLDVLKISIAILITVIMCSSAKAQAKTDIGLGMNYNKELRPMAKISVSYELNKVNIETVFQPTISRQANPDTYFGVKAGYNIHNLIPMIGYYYDYRSAENEWAGVGYSLKYVYLLGEQGGLFMEGLYVNKSTQLIAGFHIAF